MQYSKHLNFNHVMPATWGKKTIVMVNAIKKKKKKKIVQYNKLQKIS